MKSLITVFTFFLFTGTTLAQSNGARPVQSGTTLQNHIQYNEKNLSITSADGTITYKSMRDLDTQLSEAVALYRAESYSKAFPLLTELSQWGIKHAQMLLGDMYIAGRHVEQSNVRGLGWLGVAKEANSERHAKKVFQHVYDQLGQDQQKYVDRVVRNYIQKYGVIAQNYKCRKRTSVGSNIPRTECNKIPNSNSVLHPLM